MKIWILFCVFSFVIGSVNGWGWQSIIVSGEIYCHDESKPMPPGYKGYMSLYPGAEIRLMEKDVIWDDLMDETKSGYMGYFGLGGTQWEPNSLEPYLLIRHNCSDDLQPKKLPKQCYLQSRIDIPHDGREATRQILKIVLGGTPSQLKCD